MDFKEQLMHVGGLLMVGLIVAIVVIVANLVVLLWHTFK